MLRLHTIFEFTAKSLTLRSRTEEGATFYEKRKGHVAGGGLALVEQSEVRKRSIGEMRVEIQELKREILERLQPLDPERVILFGSYAYGNPTEDSDIDLYVVTKDEFVPATYAEKRELVRKISRRFLIFGCEFPWI